MKSRVIFGIGFLLAAFGQYKYYQMQERKAKKIADEVLSGAFS